MKKIILSLLVITFTSSLIAQVCVPTTPTSTAAGYIIPDSATNFNNGCAGKYYEQYIYIKAPADTSIDVTGFGVIPAHVDSFVIDANLTGLPIGLIVESVPALLTSPNSRLLIPGGTKACIKISGIMPASTPVGPINLVIPTSAYLKIFSVVPLDTAINVTYYKINVTAAPCGPAAVVSLNNYDFNLIGMIPNPSENLTTLQFESKNNKSYTMKLSNAIGEVVFSKTINAKAGINSIPVDVLNYANGLYMYSLHDGKNILSGKLQINK